MLKVTSSGPKADRDQAGYIKVVRDGEVIVYIECDYFSPHNYAIRHPMGWFAKAIRQMMLNGGCNLQQCDYVLKTGKYDPRNEGVRYTTPEQFLSRSRAEHAKLKFTKYPKKRKYKKRKSKVTSPDS